MRGGLTWSTQMRFAAAVRILLSFFGNPTEARYTSSSAFSHSSNSRKLSETFLRAKMNP